MFHIINARAWFAAAGLVCLVGVSGCPKDTDEPGTGGSGGDVSEAGKAGSTSSAGKGGAGQAGKAGGTTTAGQGGAAGKSTAGGGAGVGGKTSGGAGSTAGTGGQSGQSANDDDAGVSGARCGTRGGVMCGADEFCNFEPDVECGATDKGGQCQDKPQVCTDIYKPVCGCDLHTYGNVCEAHSAGQSQKHEGACLAQECESLGGHAELSNGGNTPTCQAGETSYPIGGTKDGGVCCLPGQGNGSGKTCGGFGVLMCAAGEFCDYEKSAGGQGCDGKIADAAGVCQTQPQACTRENAPVCGCDHRTYGNACSAHAEGKSILHDGSCTVSDCEAVSGRVAFGIGTAAMCNSDEAEFTPIVNDDGTMAIEGMLCCVKK